MELKGKRIIFVCMKLLIILCAGCMLYTAFHISDAIPAMISVMVVFVGSLLIIVWLKTMCTDVQCFIILCGYLLRIICIIIDLYGRDYVTLPNSGGDSEGFYDMADKYYSGNYNEFYTWYPYVLRGIFAVFGKNRFVAQYINIVFWIFTVILIIKICEQFHVPGPNRIAAYALLSFLPNNIILSSILLRESMMIFFDLWGMYYLIHWMKKGRLYYLILAFLVPTPAIILHTASIGLWISNVLVAAVWNRRKQRFVITLKAGMILVLFITFIGILYFTDLKRIFMGYVPDNFSIYAIAHRGFDVGESDYLQSMDYQHWYELLPFTLVRMFYFICSPVLTECRGLKDFLCVLGDVLPTVFVLFHVGVNMGKKRLSRYVFVGVLSYVVIVGIFAWGTANAGAALRHRGLLWGILIASYCIGFGKEETT